MIWFSPCILTGDDVLNGPSDEETQRGLTGPWGPHAWPLGVTVPVHADSPCNCGYSEGSDRRIVFVFLMGSGGS